jgi:uncharacterized protein (DUF1697 family)
MALYVALLRAINVGGRNQIKMPALKDCFEQAGFEDVATYIQSGNVLFRAVGSAPQLARRIEDMLGAAFGYQARVVLRSHTRMRHVVDRAPKGFGSKPGTYHSDVIFLREPLTARTALRQVPTRPEVDEVRAGPGVLYASRLLTRASQSLLSRVVTLPVYQGMTIRTWNTTTTLLRMMDDRSP